MSAEKRTITITISGPQGVGKTALAKWLLARLSHLPVLADEVVILSNDVPCLHLDDEEEGRGLIR